MPRFAVRRGTSAEAISKNVIPAEGEIVFEVDTNRFKVGDGVTRYNDLPYYMPIDDVLVEVENYIQQHGPGVTVQDLYDHIHALAPHTAYDDGPTFTLLYENAKV